MPIADRGHRSTALITGASAGIGREFAREYARRGVDLVLVARREDRLRQLAAELSRDSGVVAHVLVADLSDPQAPAQLHRAVQELGIDIDILVNNAGYGVPGSFLGNPWRVHADFQQVMVNAVIELCHLFIPPMRERHRGTIINVASLAGHMPGTAGHTLYGPAKAWMIRYSESLAFELAPAGVTVCALCPGFTYSEFHDVNGMRAQVSKLPKFLWMDAARVVREGLAAVARGDSVHIPGGINRVLALMARLLPRKVVYALQNSHAKDFRRSD